jgi:GT2 family glycosyltransferase
MTTTEHVPRDLTVGIPIRNQLPYVRACLHSLQQHSPGVPILLVDDHSDAACADWIAEYASRHNTVSVLRNARQRGFPYSCNEIFYNTSTPTVCLLNSDTLVTQDWDVRLLRAMAVSPERALAGPSTSFTHTAQELPGLRHDRLEQNATTVARIASATYERYGDRCRTLPTLGGYCLLVRRALVQQIGYFDERFGLGCGEEDDFCYRALKVGVKPCWVQGAYVHHFGHCSFTVDLGGASANLWARNRLLLDLKVAAALPEIAHPPGA